ncbi:cupin superfamily protein [Roseiarcus fermentans]|uniref:Cupin superfamily protein n=1 Tax=Roseiarcus fermentans TaxID=1473586 RepID=A0A366EJ51_9HYPH|nr:cupin domain-containing protein [Roseiarcus fermentans]RBP02006.1 cupin superfamily protein [Roseiarcus fermentans]
MGLLTFDDLLAPATFESFARERLDREPLHCARADPAFFASLFSLGDLEAYLARARPAFSKAFAIDSRREINSLEFCDAHGVVDPTRLFQLFDRGCTIVLREIDAHFPALDALCRSAEKRLQAPVFANVYYAPPGGQSFPVHYDAPDVYALQVEGTKTWRLYAPSYEKPLADQHCYGQMPEQTSLSAARLAPGDLLYVPRGFPHLVTADDGPSLHISLSAFPPTWADALAEAVSELARRDPALRAALPPGYFAPGEDLERRFAALVRKFADEAALRPALARVARRVVASRRAWVPDPIRRPRQAAGLSIESELTANREALVLLERAGDAVRLTGLGKELMFAAEALDDLAFALEATRFRIADTPGALDPEGKLDLFQTLLLNGFVSAA